jgi:Xaa-Pro aminopeptidase
MNRYGRRARRLRAALEERDVASLLVSFPPNIAYLAGFRGSAGLALYTRAEAILWIDPRYTLEAQQNAHGVEIVEVKHGLLAAAGKWIARHSIGRVGFDDAHFCTRSFSDLKRHSGRGVRFVPTGDVVEDLRFIKDNEEVASIREAGRITAEAFEEMVPEMKPGALECELAAEIEYRMRLKGAEGAAFETIVASGQRGAFPHARASRKSLQKQEFVIVDVGAIIDGYAADMTRTLYLGKPGRRVRSLYNAVLTAQERGVETLGKGVRAGDIDSAVRRSLARKALDRHFTHSTGHGVGLEVHERPHLGRGMRTRIDAGCVVTVEPGIYLEGFGGVRIEDTVLVSEAGPEILTPASKTNWFFA